MSEIKKIAIYDERVIDKAEQGFAIYKGASSIIAQNFAATNPNTSKVNHLVQFPSTESKLQMTPKWHGELNLAVSVLVSGTYPAGNANLLSYGTDFSSCAFPMHSIIETATLTFNGVPFPTNLNMYLQEVLRATQVQNAKYQSCPSNLDDFCFYDDEFGTGGPMLSNYSNAVPNDYVGNGSYGRVYFTYPNGNIIPQSFTGALGYTNDLGTATWAINGIPVCSVDGTTATAAATTFTVYIKIVSDENIMMSPFVYNESMSDDHTGMHGISKMECNINVKNDVSRLLRCPTNAVVRNRVIQSVSFNTLVNGGPIVSSINCVFLEPNEQLGLTNQVSVVPYLKFDPQPIQRALAWTADPTVFKQMQSGVLPLTIVPDGVFIYAKPASYDGLIANFKGFNAGDFHYVIEAMTVAVGAKTSQLLNFTREQLYDVSLHNGVDMEYNEWCGSAISTNGVKIPLTGSIVYLKFGKDIVLPAMDVASGVGGDYSLSVNVTLKNQTGKAILTDTELYVVPVYSGFLESKGGKTNVRDIILQKSDVMNMDLDFENPMTDQSLQRMVGGSWLSKISSVISKGIDTYKAIKPILSTVKNALPADGNMGKLKSALSAVGAGKRSGAGATISDRLKM